MKLLLDTHIVLWALADDVRLSASRRDILIDGASQLYVSAASLWEIAIKRALGKLKAPEGIRDVLRAAGCAPLPITWEHAERAGGLPPHHADLFGRLLIAQAQLEDMPLMTADDRISAYGVTIL